MMLPQISQSTVENLEREVIHSGGALNYTLDKVDLLIKENKELLELITSLSLSIKDKESRMQAVAMCVATAYAINTQLEIDWLKQSN
jgi:hypothetical protein